MWLVFLQNASELCSTLHMWFVSHTLFYWVPSQGNAITKSSLINCPLIDLAFTQRVPIWTIIITILSNLVLQNFSLAVLKESKGTNVFLQSVDLFNELCFKCFLLLLLLLIITTTYVNNIDLLARWRVVISWFYEVTDTLSLGLLVYMPQIMTFDDLLCHIFFHFTVKALRERERPHSPLCLWGVASLTSSIWTSIG